ncbi:MAG: TAXI family TRAP transporter solute-binding subunit [Bacillota bacterium]
MRFRRLVAALATIVLATTIVGCSSGTKAPSTPAPSQQPQQDTKQEQYPSNWPKNVVLAGGIMGGPWYPLMVKVSQVLMREIKGLNVTVIEGGSLANCRLIQKGQDAQMGLAYANIVFDARNGVYDNTKMTDILATNAFMTSYVQFMAPKNSSIKTLEEMFNKRIGSSPRGGGPDLIWQIVLSHYGKTYDDVRKAGGSVSFVNYSEVATLLKNGQLDVGLFQGECPHASAVEAETSVALRPVPVPKDVIDALHNKFPFLTGTTIPQTAYKGMTEPVETLSIPGVFIVNKNLPEDFVYTVLKTIMVNNEEIKSAFNFVDLLGYENFKVGISDDMWHPAAKKVYEEGKK